MSQTDAGDAMKRQYRIVDINIEITDPKTGEKRTWEGPAFSALAPQED